MKQQAEAEFFDGFVEEHGEYDVLGEGAYTRLLSPFDSLWRPIPRGKYVEFRCENVMKCCV